MTKNHLNEFTYFKKQTVLDFLKGWGSIITLLEVMRAEIT